MNSKILEREQKLIEKYISIYGHERTNRNRGPITDGIVNIKQYCKNEEPVPKRLVLEQVEGRTIYQVLDVTDH